MTGVFLPSKYSFDISSLRSAVATATRFACSRSRRALAI